MSQTKGYLMNMVDGAIYYRETRAQRFPNDFRNRESVECLVKLRHELCQKHDDDPALLSVDSLLFRLPENLRVGDQALLSQNMSAAMSFKIGRFGFGQPAQKVDAFLAQLSNVLCNEVKHARSWV